MRRAPQKVMPDFCNRRYKMHYVTALNTLARMGINLGDVDLMAIGIFENYRGEVHYQEPAPGTPLDGETGIRLKIGASSAVDYMPYQFFYGLQGVTRRIEKWEDRARALMAPFDAAVLKFTARSHRTMLTHGAGLIEKRQLMRFLELFRFDVDDSLPEEELLLLTSLLPQYHYWSGNPDFLEKALRRMFGFEFQVTENVPQEFRIPDRLKSRLGQANSRLGTETVIGKSFAELDSTYRVSILNVPAARAKELMPGGAVRAKIDWLIHKCMPSHLEYQIDVRVDREPVRLGPTSPTARVGYTAFIASEEAGAPAAAGSST